MSTRPAGLVGSPEASSQLGPRLPVQASVGLGSWFEAGTRACSLREFRRSGTPAASSRVSPSRLADLEPRWSWSPRSCRLGLSPRWRKAKATSTAAAPPPWIRIAWGASRPWHQAKKGSRGFTGKGPELPSPHSPPSAAPTAAPTSRLSRSQAKGGRPASTSSWPARSKAVTSACTKVTPVRAQSRLRSMAHSSGL